MRIPKELFAGVSATWLDDPTQDANGGTIDSTWTLKYEIAAAAVLTLTATANGSGWTTSITKAQTTTLAAGDYLWQAYAETGSRRETLGTGRIKIKAAPTAGASGKSQTQQDLDTVEGAIRAMMTGGAVQEYSIGGRSMRKMSMADLILWRDKLKSQLQRERKAEMIANGQGNPSNIYTRFRR